MVADSKERSDPSPRQIRVLFLGGRNSCRSVMAEAFLRAEGVPGLVTASAGVVSGGYDPKTSKVMAEIGLETSGHEPRSVEELQGATFDVVVTVCNDARTFRTEALKLDQTPRSCPTGKSPLLVGAPVHIDWRMADPAQAEGSDEEVLAVYREVRDRVRTHVKPLTEHGYLRAFAGQRRSFEQLIDSLDEGVMAHDDSGHIYLFNSAAERITGYKRDEVLGTHCHSTFESGGLCGAICPIKRGEAHSVSASPDYQINFINRSGEDRRLKMAVKPVLDGPGHSSGVVVAMRDITEVSELRYKLKERLSFRGMVGQAQAMQDVFDTIRQVSVSDYPVLITGESGTGKELVASAIHQESRRAGGPFIAVNCGALPEDILESELFGHVRGAFTGAVRDKKGRFELANGGTLFLDEAGELTPSFQVKLLRVLEQKRFERVGSERPVHVDVRIISATNRDLRTMVAQGQFREDLFYRLSVVPIELPALRERAADIPALVEKVLADVRQETGKEIRRLDDQAMDALMAHPWPGNVRELINCLQAAAVRCEGAEILLRHLPLDVRSERSIVLAHPSAELDSSRARTRRRVKLNRDNVQQALGDSGGNKVEAAKRLGVGRATLYRFLSKNSML